MESRGDIIGQLGGDGGGLSRRREAALYRSGWDDLASKPRRIPTHQRGGEQPITGSICRPHPRGVWREGRRSEAEDTAIRHRLTTPQRRLGEEQTLTSLQPPGAKADPYQCLQ